MTARTSISRQPPPAFQAPAPLPLNQDDKGRKTMMNPPRIFKIALLTLCISIGLQMLAVFLMKDLLLSWGALSFNILIVLPLTLSVFLAYKISKGKNWARISFLGLFILMLPAYFIYSFPLVYALLANLLEAKNWSILLSSALVAPVVLLQAFSLCVFFSKPSALFSGAKTHDFRHFGPCRRMKINVTGSNARPPTSFSSRSATTVDLDGRRFAEQDLILLAIKGANHAHHPANEHDPAQ